MAVISFTGVDQPYGWLGNMAPFRIDYMGQRWLTSEALFQSMRYDDLNVQELIRIEKSPMIFHANSSLEDFHSLVRQIES